VADAVAAFYEGAATDHRGRSLREILQWSDDRLESVHDYIQWLFPLPEPSQVNPQAPLVKETTVQAFAEREELRVNLRASLDRMLRFYGLELFDGPPVEVIRADNFIARAGNWLWAGNHNHLRITRILKCCTLLGLAAEARAFLACLEDIYAEERRKPHAQPNTRITAESMRYWRNAASG
jgi:hypothetical protein